MKARTDLLRQVSELVEQSQFQVALKLLADTKGEGEIESARLYLLKCEAQLGLDNSEPVVSGYGARKCAIGIEDKRNN